MEFSHTTVMLYETVEGLNVKPDAIYVDGTLGGGGHSALICSKLGSDGMLIGIDQDEFALNYAKKRLEPFTCQKKFINNNFVNLKTILQELEITQIDGIIFDLGVSSFQLDDETRGFSYHHDGPLDMRMDKQAELSAYDVVNKYAFKELVAILRNYGEEKHANRIVKAIIQQREIAPITRTLELADLIKKAYPPKERYKQKHPARKTFQAIRLEVNHELNILKAALSDAIAFLKPGGRIGVITFHSLEDRIVKHLFQEQENPCICPSDFPQCVCGRKPQVKRITRKPTLPSTLEIENNRRSRSAKLRIAEKIEEK